jgi:hypothetical protein
MIEQRDPHKGLHSAQGALAGEHPGRAVNPVVKVHDLAWLEFEKPDLQRAEVFGRAFGFVTVSRTAEELQLRGTDAGAPCVLIRKGPRSRFVGTAFRAADPSDVVRCADATGRTVAALPESLGGVGVDLRDPSVGGLGIGDPRPGVRILHRARVAHRGPGRVRDRGDGALDGRVLGHHQGELGLTAQTGTHHRAAAIS